MITVIEAIIWLVVVGLILASILPILTPTRSRKPNNKNDN